MIKLVIFDIDGVITDGSIIVDENGVERKRLNLKDVDAIFELHKRGYQIAAITGEDSKIVNYFENRFPWQYFYRGKKSKMEAIIEIEEKSGINRQDICYIGDGKYDIEPLQYVKLGICPANAIDDVKNACDIILKNDGGKGCLWEMTSILDDINNNECSNHYFRKRLIEHMDTIKQISSDPDLLALIMEVADKTTEVFRKKGTVYLCGNGGSAADAQHIATEFTSRFFKERNGLKAEALGMNVSTLTAIGNDYSFDRIFVRELEAKAVKGDLLIGLSTSGKSMNVIEALKYGHQNGLNTVMLTGANDLSSIKSMVDYLIQVPSSITPRIQEAHIFIGHVIAEYVESKLFD